MLNKRDGEVRFQRVVCEIALLTTLSTSAFVCFVQVPFPTLQGEGVEFLGRADDAIIAISNYRLHIKFKDSIINVRDTPHTHTIMDQSCDMFAAYEADLI